MFALRHALRSLSASRGVAHVAIALGANANLTDARTPERLDVQRVLRDGARGASGAHTLWGRGHRLRRLLVVPPGFSADGVLSLELTLAGPRYPNADAVRQAYKRLWEAFEAMPGVTASGGVTALPLSNFFAWGPITIDGRVSPSGKVFINADMRTVGGRLVTPADTPISRARSSLTNAWPATCFPAWIRSASGSSTAMPPRRPPGRPSSAWWAT